MAKPLRRLTSANDDLTFRLGSMAMGIKVVAGCCDPEWQLRCYETRMGVGQVPVGAEQGSPGVYRNITSIKNSILATSSSSSSSSGSGSGTLLEDSLCSHLHSLLASVLLKGEC